MIRTTTALDRWSRPVLWGFFVSGALAALLLVVRWFVLSYAERNWGTTREEKERRIAAAVQSSFGEKLNFLLDEADRIRGSREFFRLLNENTPVSIVQAFELLERLRPDELTSIDVVDPRGTIVAWAGRSVLPDYRQLLPNGGVDTFTVVSQSGLHKYVSIGVPVPEHHLLLVLNRFVESDYPISNRFVSLHGFSDDLSGEIGAAVRILARRDEPEVSDEQVLLMPLLGVRGDRVAFAQVPKPMLERELQWLSAPFDTLVGVALSSAALLLAAALALRFVPVLPGWAGASVIIALTWVVRYVWRLVDFPSRLVGGFLFDPAVYASPFAFGLTSSLGDLLLSCLALLATAIVVVAGTLRWAARRSTRPRRSSVASTGMAAAGAVVLALVFQWVIRGFGAAVRSFVFDSTLRFQDPTGLVPELPTVVMILNVSLLAFAFLCLFVAVLLVLFDVVRRILPRASDMVRGAVLVLALSGAAAVYFAIDRVPQCPWYCSLVLFLLGAVYVVRIWVKERPSDAREFFTFRNISLLWLGAFVVSGLALDVKVHEKERLRAQLLAVELLRPVDSWLSFVVTDGFRVAVDRTLAVVGDRALDPEADANLAFLLWAETLMGREGYNSALFVYSNLGEEVSRFSVGLTAYEQVEILSRIFDTEEEQLIVVDRKLPGGTIKYYGLWGTVRDDMGQLVGTAALIVSASQSILFRGDAPDVLRPTSRDHFEHRFRRVSISEYQWGILVSTTDERLYRGLQLPRADLERLHDPDAKFLWSTAAVDGRSFDVLYANDDATPGRVLALSLEHLDLRWHLFNLVKLFTVFALFLGAVGLGFLVRARRRREEVTFGFREKLVTSFALLSIVPLLVMAYYNRELAIERVEESVTRKVFADLELIHQRIITSVQDEDDFSIGVNDDYCEVLASELGVDFSVYGRTTLKASSRPELYRAAILDDRLPGNAFANTVLLGRSSYRITERVGRVDYVVGFRPLYLEERFAGVLAVPALYRQSEIDEELAQRNAFVLSAYAVVVLLIILVGILLAGRLSGPLRELAQATKEIARGNLDIRLAAKSRDEVGDLVRSFNEMAADLKASRDNLARIERELAWKEMAKQVAHEIKNPLTPMKLSIQHLLQAHRDKAKDFAEILQRVAQTVIEQIEALSRIATEFSYFARMPEPRFDRVEVHQILRETESLFKQVQGIEFRSNFSDTPATLIADADELRRVFINIIRNSIQAMDRGGVITIETEVSRDLCTITISDTGSGIPGELQARVFQPNFSTKTDGMGIGLAIAKKIIEDLNGSIFLRSEPGKGTTIELRLPLRFS